MSTARGDEHSGDTCYWTENGNCSPHAGHGTVDGNLGASILDAAGPYAHNITFSGHWTPLLAALLEEYNPRPTKITLVRLTTEYYYERRLDG
ncbi:hypothetical protein LSAT2_029717 [Lamellibrachia satsuma]|nr:hypothetical protein LSAT2_029717 [Lamellibrachia satsuma]